MTYPKDLLTPGWALVYFSVCAERRCYGVELITIWWTSSTNGRHFVVCFRRQLR
jgi:hypothetical protein